MSESEEQTGCEGSRKDPEKKKGSSTRRKLAEWVTMTISALLILGIGGFLLFQALRPREPYIPVEIRLLHGNINQVGKLYILPFELKNRGKHALRELRVEVSYTSPEGKEETRDMDISYLGELSVKTAYLYFEHPPKTLGVEVKPLHYLLD